MHLRTENKVTLESSSKRLHELLEHLEDASPAQEMLIIFFAAILRKHSYFLFEELILKDNQVTPRNLIECLIKSSDEETEKLRIVLNNVDND